MSVDALRGARLKEERERLKLSQADMAAAVGIRREMWARYEAGTEPGAAVLTRAAIANVDVIYVLTAVRSDAQVEARGAALRARHGSAAAVPAIYDPLESSAGLLGAAMAHIARETAGAWLTYPTPADPARPDTTQAGGFHQVDDGRPRNLGALLPAEQGAALQPLVLQLLLGESSGEIDYHVIPRRMLPAAAGRGVAANAKSLRQLDLAGDMAFTADWLRANLGHTSGAICSVKVQGDSMSGTLMDGETILVDQGVSQVDVDGIYVLEIYGRQLVKRVQRLFDGSLVLISDNEQYQREQIPRDQARDVVVVGRMVYPRVR